MLGPICVEQQISDPFIQLIKKIYIPKQRSFIYLTNSCSITFQQSFIRAVGRFDMIVGFRYMSCLTFRSLTINNIYKYIQKILVTKQIEKE